MARSFENVILEIAKIRMIGYPRTRLLSGWIIPDLQFYWFVPLLDLDPLECHDPCREEG
jgi:hypothetical protein